jgi:hypothetical protein
LRIDFRFNFRPNRRRIFSQRLRCFVSRFFIANVVPVTMFLAALAGQESSMQSSDFRNNARRNQSLFSLEASREIHTFPFFDECAKVFVAHVRVNGTAAAA